MIRSENLDVRAVTMGISLDDCAAGEPRRTAERIHAKIVRRAGTLVEVAAELQEKYGVPIVNRRVSVTPIAGVVGSDDPTAYVRGGARARRGRRRGRDRLPRRLHARSSRRASRAATRALIEAIPDAHRPPPSACAPRSTWPPRAPASTWTPCCAWRDVLLAVSKRTAEHDSIGCAKLVVFCNAPEDNPFMAGAMHGSGEAECSHQRRHLRPRRGAQRRRRRSGRLVHRARRPHQAHRRSRSRASAS